MAKLKGKAKANARKKAQAQKNAQNGIPNMTQGKGFKLPKTPLGGVMFNLNDELAKMTKVVTQDITPYNTRANSVDFHSMNWGNDGGFFIAVVPRNPQGLYGFNDDFQNLYSITKNYKIVPLGEHWALMSCFCSADRAFGHLNEIADNFKYAFIGYSTLRCLAPMAEDRDMCLALRDGKKPVVKLVKESA